MPFWPDYSYISIESLTAAHLLQAAAMLSDHGLCARVVAWKGRVFARQWARYELAQPGSFKLLPSEARIPELSRDYSEMRPMFMTPPPAFNAVLDELLAAEKILNDGGA